VSILLYKFLITYIFRESHIELINTFT